MIAKLISILSMLASGMSVIAAGWERLAPLPEPNAGCVAGTVGDDVIVLGGTNWRDDTKHWLKAVWRYDSATKTWRSAGELPNAIAYAPTAQSGDGFYFAGGSDGTVSHRSLQMVDAKLQVRTVARLDAPVIYTFATFAGGRFYFAGGGTDPADLSTWGNSFRSVEPATGRITALPVYPGGRVAHVVLVSADEDLFAFTGAAFDAAKKEVVNSNAAFVFSLKTQLWRPAKAFPFSVRGLSGMNLDGRHIYLAGGYKNDAEEFTADAFIYDIATGRYIAAPSLPYRAMVSLVKCGEWLYCLGGEDRKKHRTDAAFRIRWRELLPR